MKLPKISRKARPQSLEAVAYFEGAHGTDLKPGLERIQATFDQKVAQLGHEAVAREKKHEETLGQVNAMLPSAEARAANINSLIGDEKPQLLVPLLAILAALFMAAAEVVLLAPALDVLYITSPVAQYFAAVGIMCVSCLAFHFAWESFTSVRFPRIWKATTRGIALGVAGFLVIWGILRGEQVAFASNLNDNPLGRFLSGHPILAAGFYVFVTLAVPLVVATATHFGFHHLRDWREWSSANALLKGLKQSKVNAEKQLETEREQHKQALKQLGQEGAEWKATYQIHHERGRKHLAVQDPITLVYLKTAGAAILASLALCWAPASIVAGGATVTGIVAFLHFRRKREHPNPEQYYAIQSVQFVPQTRNVPTPPEKPLLEGKSEPTRPKKGLPA